MSHPFPDHVSFEIKFGGRTLIIRASLLLLLASTASAGERPNILLIVLDDAGYSDIGFYGSEIDTPHIDDLAEGGV